MARTPLQDHDPTWVGRYRLTARLGAGGMGVVYLAATQDGSQVAVKVLQPGLTSDPEFRTRFGREVAALIRVRGMCTVRVIEADTTSARPFLVTEYVDGPSLAEYIESHGPLDPRMLYGLAAGLAEALTAIHAAGIVHRDLKPSNVLLSASGPKVIDFGIAQALDATAVTRTGMTIGSAGYMAPEQIMGQAVMASDVFSWAVTIAYAASGQPPFGAGTSDVILYRVLHAEPDIAAVPPALLPQVTAALAKEPQTRPTAPELLSQLTRTVTQPGQSYAASNPTQTLLAQTWRPPTGVPAAGRPPEATRPTPPSGLPAATRPTPPAGVPAATRPTPPPDAPYVPPPRRSRSALFAIGLAVAIVVGAGVAVLAFALAGHHAANPGTTSSQSQTAPATPAVTSSSAPAPASSSASSPSQSTSAPASSSPTTSSSPSASSSSTPSSTPTTPSSSTPTPAATGG